MSAGQVMALLSRDAVLAAKDIQTEDVPVPEWGGTVRVKVMTGTERDAFSAALLANKDKGSATSFAATLVAATLVDDVGHLMFSPADVGGLSGKSFIALQRVEKVAARLNSIGDAAVGAAEGN